MTLGNLRQLGVRGVVLSCLAPRCRHEESFSVDDYPDEVEVPSFAARAVCTQCGGAVEARPNWNEMRILPPKA
jgi:hypothetical protein